MKNDGDDNHQANTLSHSDREASGNLSKRGRNKIASFDLEKNTSTMSNDDIVEVIIDDSETIQTSTGSETAKRPSRAKKITREIKRLSPFPKRRQRRESDGTKSSASNALGLLNFISKADSAGGWKEVEKRFWIISNYTEGLLRRAHFGICIGMIPMPDYLIPKPEDKKYKDEKLEDERRKFKDLVPKHKSQDFAVQLFDALSREKNISGGSISVSQLRDFWEQISDQSFDGRLQTLFNMFDKDGDGRITKTEVKEIIALSASANVLSDIKKRADEYAALIMEELDPDNIGYIMIENLEMLLLGGPVHLVRGEESEELNRKIGQMLKPVSDSSYLSRWYEDLKYFLLDNWQRVWVMVLWIGVMAGLFAYKYVQYKNRAAFDVMGHCVCMAKGAAETLKLNMALILLPVCRNTITWLRNKTRLGVAVPLADNLEFHKVIAIAIAIGVGVHGISHLACDFPRLLHATEEEYQPMEKYFGDQPTSYWWFIKGVEGVTGIIMVVLMTIAFTLASPWFRRNIINLPKPFNKVTGFKAFWYSHHLFVIVYALLIVHGIKLYLTTEWYNKTTWMYIAVPVVLYASERLVRAFRSSIKPVEIRQVAIYDGNLLALRVSKPNGFEYRSGQYMFIKCTAVSQFEWHPFSISSAPGDHFLSVHIKGLGDWTKDLITKFSENLRIEKSGLLRADELQRQNINKSLKVSIDGPYGAPAQDYKNYDVVLLVGLGIGATPMISIIKDIANNMNANDEMSSDREDGTGASPGTQREGGNNFRTKKAYFYWVTREQGSFNWFKDIMDEVAEMDRQEVIEMHIHGSSVYEEGDARSAIITMLQSINQAKNGVDVVAGTKRVKSHFGRPEWEEVYKNISMKHPNTKIGVFYCGLPVLAKELAQQASNFSKKTPFKFDFHKEIF